ncbi:copper chaperone PCu(A)C [Rhodococcus sp. IEGM 1408]|uniref:copper chaperone PCu(A)C n=1 Tax=Rhodococcus sp. IEGM 1408 TaxID=3082220 RepID=UPI00295357FC|nr:copper chaperone PCu(A)C [Rhodococcus sp. IEGM 1408]MDV7999646.1 copper chaperone PCu(A)C [Rhodococcus sp. IEGM 1408]
MRSTSRFTHHFTPRAALAAAAALTLALTTAACASDDAATDPTASDQSTATVAFDDGWVKATDTDMSGVFGTLRNPGEADVHLTGVSGDIGGSPELHETVPGGGGGMMMQEKEGGFVIPTGGELVLAPGGNHIMLMGLERPITTGQQITLTLELDGGAEQDITVSARDFKGGQEEYVGGHGDADGGGTTGGMSHDG